VSKLSASAEPWMRKMSDQGASIPVQLPEEAPKPSWSKMVANNAASQQGETGREREAMFSECRVARSIYSAECYAHEAIDLAFIVMVTL
jgi:hypothetical protein